MNTKNISALSLTMKTLTTQEDARLRLPKLWTVWTRISFLGQPLEVLITSQEMEEAIFPFQKKVRFLKSVSRKVN